jgi:hypothetical protein
MATRAEGVMDPPCPAVTLMVMTDLMRPSKTDNFFAEIAILHAPGQVAASCLRHLHPLLE